MSIQPIPTQIKEEPVYTVTIWVSGDIAVIKQICREYCMHKGFCVSVTPTDFIYTGGSEFGVQIGIVNYPRFPSTGSELVHHAKILANEIIIAACQWSALIITPEKSIWLNRRGEDSK